VSGLRSAAGERCERSLDRGYSRTVTSGASLIDNVATWEGVTLEEGRFGSTRFMVGRRELGHVHGDSVLDMPLPKALKAELIARGEARQHRFTKPDSGWVTIELDGSDESRERAVALLRERYEHAREVARSRAAPR
jgi:Luciferase